MCRLQWSRARATAHSFCGRARARVCLCAQRRRTFRLASPSLAEPSRPRRDPSRFPTRPRLSRATPPPRRWARASTPTRGSFARVCVRARVCVKERVRETMRACTQTRGCVLASGERLPPIPRPGTRTLRLRLHRSSRVISLSPISTMPPYTYNVEPDTASCALMRPRGRGASRGGRSPLAGAYRSSDTAPPRRYVLYA